jgi:hypothetical protein
MAQLIDWARSLATDAIDTIHVRDWLQVLLVSQQIRLSTARQERCRIIQICSAPQVALSGSIAAQNGGYTRGSWEQVDHNAWSIHRRCRSSAAVIR